MSLGICVILTIVLCAPQAFSYILEGRIINDTEDLKWPGGIVPWKMSPYFTEKEVLVILNAMETISNQSCVRFTPHVNEKDFLMIEASRQHSECLSSYGYKPGKQTIFLRATVETNCIEHSNVLHHFMRILGFPYEHLRPDRDDHITIDWSNVRKNKMLMFQKLSNHQFIYDVKQVEFDFSSVMIPNSARIAIDAATPIIISKGLQETVIRSKVGLSEGDIAKILNAYDCRINSTLSSSSMSSELKVSFVCIALIIIGHSTVC